MAVTVKLSEIEVASVLAATDVNEMAVTMARAIVPLASVLDLGARLDLNAVTMSNRNQFWKYLFVNLTDIFNDKRLYTFLVEDSQRVDRFLDAFALI